MWGNELDAYWLFQIDLCKETKLTKVAFLLLKILLCLHTKCKFPVDLGDV